MRKIKKMINIEPLKRELFDQLDLFRKKLQAVQENQVAIAKNQEILSEQNNKIIEAIQALVQGLTDEEEQ